uniref:histidine kinase n=1 Tax=candidate division WOR-3 bacterium TaxID=2052148 RepID=A0A7C3F1H4_UNCW3
MMPLFHSIRGRIASAIIITALLILPVVLLALYYIGEMNHLATVIAETDTELLRQGNIIIRYFHEVRTAERNYMLTGDPQYLLTARLTLNQLVIRSERSRRFAPELKPQFDSLVSALRAYNLMIDSLIQFRTLRFSATPTLELNRLWDQRRLLIEQTSTIPADAQTTVDSLLNAISKLDQEIEFYQLLGSMRTMFHQRLADVSRTIITLAESITSRANQRIVEHKARVTRLFIWSQRNIITSVLILCGLLIYLIFTLPRAVILPLKRITNALHRVENGDFDIRITLETRDELGNLARQLNRVFVRLRELDELKSGQIVELERRFRLLASNIKEGVLVVDRNLKIIYVNPAAEPLLGIRPNEATGKSCMELSNLKPFLPHLQQLLSGAASHQECEIIPAFASSAVCFETLRNREGTIIAALVIITNPVPPEPLEETSS